LVHSNHCNMCTLSKAYHRNKISLLYQVWVLCRVSPSKFCFSRLLHWLYKSALDWDINVQLSNQVFLDVQLWCVWQLLLELSVFHKKDTILVWSKYNLIYNDFPLPHKCIFIDINDNKATFCLWRVGTDSVCNQMEKLDKMDTYFINFSSHLSHRFDKRVGSIFNYCNF